MDNKINLNSFVYNEQITREDIFNVISQEDIYSFYVGFRIEDGDRINSPLRKDSVPSFGFFYRRDRTGILMYNDLATHDSGDCIIFVCKLFKLDYKDALFKIAYDFNLSKIEITSERKKIINSVKIIDKTPIKIGIKSRNWKSYDAKFWKSFGICKKTLIKYNVIPIQYVFYNGNPTKTDKHAYAYLEFKDNTTTYKIYQPFNKKYKWINNANYSVHQGYSQLPKKGNLLIITKSLKDVMSIRDVVKIPSVALQSESVMIKDTVMDEYKFRFKKVVCLFDNDNAGKKLSSEFVKMYDIEEFFMPNIKNVTDFSDLVKKIGVKKSIEKFNQIFKKVL